MSCTYESVYLFLESKTKMVDRVKAIDLLIDQMILSLSDQAAGPGSGISEYSLDDGQVKIKTGYRSFSDVESGIQSLERMKQLYINRLNGRVIILRDEKSFRR